jgi:hypothetical protein
MLDDCRSTTSMLLLLVLLVSLIDDSRSFLTTFPPGQRQITADRAAAAKYHGRMSSASSFFQLLRLNSTPQSTPSTMPSSGSSEWEGDVVSTKEGMIQGCTVQANGETEWTITIDGVEADLGKFGLAIYKKIIMDAKKQSFQGFRPGTIPPFLETTYRAYCMDECARETVMEAIQQNNIRPFESCRADMDLYDFTIPPAAAPKKKKTTRKKKKGADAAEAPAPAEEEPPQVEVEPQWRSFANMKEAIDAGWQPGQSFSFRARMVRGQQVQPDNKGRTMDPLTGRIA